MVGDVENIVKSLSVPKWYFQVAYHSVDLRLPK